MRPESGARRLCPAYWHTSSIGNRQIWCLFQGTFPIESHPGLKPWAEAFCPFGAENREIKGCFLLLVVHAPLTFLLRPSPNCSGLLGHPAPIGWVGSKYLLRDYAGPQKTRNHRNGNARHT